MSPFTSKTQYITSDFIDRSERCLRQAALRLGVAGLDARVDDYVVKPFSIEELLVRIRAHLQRLQETDEDLLQFEGLSLNSRTREVFRGKRSVELTVKEFDLLEYLLSLLRQVFTINQNKRESLGLRLHR